MRKVLVGVALAGAFFLGSPGASAQPTTWVSPDGSIQITVNMEGSALSAQMPGWVGDLLDQARGLASPSEVPSYTQADYLRYLEGLQATAPSQPVEAAPAGYAPEGAVQPPGYHEMGAFPDKHEDWGGPPDRTGLKAPNKNNF